MTSLAIGSLRFCCRILKSREGRTAALRTKGVRKMNTMRWLNTGALIGTLIFTPAVLLGVQACQPETTARATNSENFSGSASGLLKDIREDAQRVHYHARVIEDFTNSQEADWEAHAHELRRIKAEVDDMGRRLCQAGD